MTYDARYAKRWHYARSRGVLQWTDVEPARNHTRSLMGAGFSTEAIATAAGISGTAVRGVAGLRAATATTNINRRHASRLLSIDAAAIMSAPHEPTTLVPAVGAKRRIRALLALGHRLSDIDAAMGERPRLAKYLAERADDMSITFDKHRAAVRAYDRLWDKAGPNRRGVDDARRRGYLPPLAWDDDAIDDPDARPDLGERTHGGAVEDIAWLIEQHPRATATQLAMRLGYRDSSAIQNALRRAGRTDLLEQLARNAEAAA